MSTAGPDALPGAVHGDLMDRIYRHQRHIYDFTRKFYLLGRDRLIADLAPPAGGRVLEIGCGTGRNLIAIARRYPKAPCFGVDISAEMLETARASAQRAGVAERVTVAWGDASRLQTSAAFGIARFDRVVMSYTLSMIPAWTEALEQAAGVLAPDGSLHIVDFGQQENLPRWFRAVLFRWLALFRVTPRRDLKAELQRVADKAGLVVQTQSLYGGYAVAATLRRP